MQKIIKILQETKNECSEFILDINGKFRKNDFSLFVNLLAKKFILIIEELEDKPRDLGELLQLDWFKESAYIMTQWSKDHDFGRLLKWLKSCDYSGSAKEIHPYPYYYEEALEVLSGQKEYKKPKYQLLSNPEPTRIRAMKVIKILPEGAFIEFTERIKQFYERRAENKMKEVIKLKHMLDIILRK